MGVSPAHTIDCREKKSVCCACASAFAPGCGWLWRTKIVLNPSPAGSECRSILSLARALSHGLLACYQHLIRTSERRGQNVNTKLRHSTQYNCLFDHSDIATKSGQLSSESPTQSHSQPLYSHVSSLVSSRKESHKAPSKPYRMIACRSSIGLGSMSMAQAVCTILPRRCPRSKT